MTMPHPHAVLVHKDNLLSTSWIKLQAKDSSFHPTGCTPGEMINYKQENTLKNLALPSNWIEQSAAGERAPPLER